MGGNITQKQGSAVHCKKRGLSVEKSWAQKCHTTKTNLADRVAEGTVFFQTLCHKPQPALEIDTQGQKKLAHAKMMKAAEPKVGGSHLAGW